MLLLLILISIVAGGSTLVFQLGRARRRRLLQEALDAVAPAPSPPAHPDDERIDVRLHEVALTDGTRYWIFVSHGFATFKHPELVLSVVREAGDVAAAIAAEAMVLFRSLYRAVSRGARMQAWQSGELGGGMFRRTDLTGWALVPAEAPAEVTVPAGALTILLLTRDEAAVARIRGAPSISALIGEHCRHYPTAWWFERHRASTVERHPRGMLDGVARFQAGLWTLTTAEGPDELVVTVDRSGAAALVPILRQLGPDQLVVFSTAPSPDAAARLVWLPDRPRYGIVGPGGGDTLSGNWIAFGVNPDTSLQGASLVEDGFVCLLSSSERDALAAALAGERALELGPPERRWRLAQAG